MGIAGQFGHGHPGATAGAEEMVHVKLVPFEPLFKPEY
jgi:hypothetical protein